MTAMTGVKRDYRAVSYALASAVVGVILMRIIAYYTPIASDSYGASLASDALFTLPVQLVFFFGLPFLIYRFYGRRTVGEIMSYSSMGKFKAWYLIAVPLGICVFVLTVGISSAWRVLLDLTGYKSVTALPVKPDRFSFGFFVAEVLMTAVLPAFCEEFCMRGGLLTTARTTFKKVGCIVFIGICFGLFHQNIKQVFYTSLFGALAAYLTLEFKSIYPAMLMHFTNNFCSVYIDYATDYGWGLGGGFYDFFGSSRVWATALVYLSVAAIGVGLVYLMSFIKYRNVVDKKIEVIKDSAFDVTNKRVVLFGEFDPDRVQSLEMEKEVYGKGYAEEKFRPSARDVMIIVALGVVTLLTTLFTYVWGFFY